jgi:hypothetical protein
MSDKVISSTTQEFLDVYDIVNNTILLKDGTASIILQVGTMNFSLLAEQEQDAIIFTYGSLLNSLNYPIQISIQSQTKDVTKYLRLLDEQVQKANSDRKANLIRQYRDFVATLIKERNVLEKSFFVTIPASPAEMGLITPSNVLPGKTTFDITTIEKSIVLEKATNLLEPRRDHLISQFNRLGLYTRQLSTQEIIQNFYINYNPEAAEGQEISNNENYTTPLVRASFGGKIMQNVTNNLENPASQPVAQEQVATPVQTEVPTMQPVAPAQVEAMQPTAQTQTEVVQPAATHAAPSPQEILSGNLQANIPITNSAPELSSVPVSAEEPVLALNQEPNLAPSFSQATSEIPTAPIAPPNPSLNSSIELNLDRSLIQNPNPSTSEVPATDFRANLDLNSNPNPSVLPNAKQPTPSVNNQAPLEQNNFAEEITPMQGNLEPQTNSMSAPAAETTPLQTNNT